MTSEPAGGGVPSWRGDVALGVAAWAGTPPPEDSAQAVPEADAEAVARKILLDQLTGRARSRQELAEKLKSRGVPKDVATRLLDRFVEVGLIDDEAFARAWVSARGAEAGKGLATRALLQELRRKGVEDEVARLVLDEVDEEDEAAAARRLVEKRLRGLRSVDRTTATRRLLGMLGRKGYPAGLAAGVVREALREWEDPHGVPSDGSGDL